MEFICLGSGSAANCYIIKQDENCVLVECGYRLDETIKRIHKHNLTLANIQAVITTHEHSDHSRCVDDFRKLGFKVFTPFAKLHEFKASQLTEWLMCYTFQVKHDVNACGFVFVNTITHETILFVNDTAEFEFEEDIKKLPFDYIFIECNHTKRKLKELMENEIEPLAKLERQWNNHLSLLGTKNMLNQLNLRQAKAIYLMHLSLSGSEPEVMQEQVEKTFNVKTTVCQLKGNILL